MENDYIILLKQPLGSMFVVDDIIQLGYKIIYIGDFNNCPGLVDVFIQFDLRQNIDELVSAYGDLLSKYNVVGVVAFSEHLKIAEMKLAKKLNLLQCESDTLIYGRDKKLMKEKIKKANVPCISYKFLNQEEISTSAPFPYPFIVKPNLGYASGGVYLVKNQFEFEKAQRAIKRLNFFVLQNENEMQAGILCEEFIDGLEFSVDSIHVDGKVRSICICQRGFPSEENFSDYIYITPPENCPAKIEDFQEIISRVSIEMGYRHGPSHAEFRIDKKTGKIYLLEIGLRVGFTGNIGRLCNLSTGFEYNKRAILAQMKKLSFEELQSFSITPIKIGLSYIPNTGSGGQILKIRGLEYLKNENRIKNYYFNKGPGEIVIPWPKGLEYLGEITAITDSQIEMKQLLSEINSNVVIEYK